jgi:hypothetical protein
LLLPRISGKQATIGGRSGLLVRPIPNLFGLYRGHYLFRFRAGGKTYLATLHGLESDRNTLRLLNSLVAALAPARTL